ncbi:hypothetical protein Pme01_21580 [Planosporangium mesophilum]|uniref:Uncharacterized protein n=1 Tax=Planosporangium mesophilum TaxID=689768 RepID=A0A8J3TBQ2_9ACTN|nr:hypothetical protein Pme01_21580 [Planosporangium mesophilum]
MSVTVAARDRRRSPLTALIGDTSAGVALADDCDGGGGRGRRRHAYLSPLADGPEAALGVAVGTVTAPAGPVRSN